MKNALTWFPMHVDSWLFGSTRNELNPAQRGVFVDLLALSMKDGGYIRANEETPYPLSQLAGLLFLDVDLLDATIERCIQVGKITRLENGTLKISSYEKYQLSRMTRWRAEHRAEHQAAADPTPPPHPPSSEKGDESRGENSRGRKCNVVIRKRNLTSPPPDMRVGEGPRSKMTEEKIRSYRPTIERNIRESAHVQAMPEAEREAFVSERLEAWEADMRREMAR